MHLLARYLEILPLFFAPALPMNEEWKIRPYLGVFPDKNNILVEILLLENEAKPLLINLNFLNLQHKLLNSKVMKLIFKSIRAMQILK